MAALQSLTAFVARSTRITADWLNAVDKTLTGPIWRNPRGDGAVADGTTSDATAFSTAASAAFASSFSAYSGMASSSGIVSEIRLPPGNYYYDGAGIDAAKIRLIGSGPNTTRITLGANSYLFNCTSFVQSVHIEGVQVVGGKGLFRHTYTAGANVGGPATFRDLWLIGYSECGIGTLSSDYPYWDVNRVLFRGLNASAIGLAHAGDASGGVIHNCLFDRNRYHLKLGKAGLGWRVTNNDFIRVAANPGNSVVDIWCVPSADLASGGQCFTVAYNKFGNELLDPTDYRVLYADEGTGTDFLTKYHSASASTGYVRGPVYANNHVQGTTAAAAVPFIYSTTNRILQPRITNNQLIGGAYRILGLLDGAGTDADRTVSMGIYDAPLSYSLGNESVTSGYPLTKPHYGVLVDPLGIYQDQPESIRGFGGAGSMAEYSAVFTTAPASWSLVGTMTRSTGVADMVGGTAAAEFTVGATASSSAQVAMTGHTANRPHYVEIDLAPGSSDALTVVELRFADTSGGTIRFRKFVNVPSDWRRFRWLWYPSHSNSITLQIRGNGAETGKVKVGRFYIYEAREPVNTGPIKLGPTTGVAIYTGSGSPEDAVTAPVGSAYWQQDAPSGAEAWWLKTSGSGDTGWVQTAA